MGSCRHLKRILVGAVLPLAVAASACGGSTTLSPVAAIAAALAKTSSQNTARVTMTIALTGLPGTQGSVIIPAHGEIDIDHHRADLTMNFPQMAGLPVQIGRMEAIIDGTTFYLRSPTLTQAAHLSTPWIKLDLSKLSPQLADLRSLSPAGSDPSQALEFLRGVSNVKTVGTETIGGVQTTHYRGTIDLNKAVQQAPASAQATLRQVVSQIQKSGGATTLPVDVWVGTDNRIHRMVMQIPTPSASGAASAGRVTVRMDLSDYGAAVNIAPPPADQVTDLSQLLGGGASGSSGSSGG